MSVDGSNGAAGPQSLSMRNASMFLDFLLGGGA